MNKISDNQVNNKKVFEYIFLSWYEQLCSYAFYILKSKGYAEEVVQDVFIKMWENNKELNIETSVKAYLFKAVHNNCLNFIKHKKIEENYSSQFKKENFDLISPLSTDYPIANLLSQELGNAIQNAISSLPAQCQEVFIRIRQDEMSYAEVAEVMGISVNTVKTQLQRAVAKLRESLKEFLP